MKRLTSFGLILFSLIHLTACGFMFSKLEKYQTFDSPDGRFKIVVMRKSKFFGLAPGQAGDAPGEVRLLDKDGNILQKTDVEMVQIVEKVEWKPRSVHIKLVADWELPD